MIKTLCERISCNCRDGLEKHHVVPRSQGGDDSDSNIMILCHKCHAEVTEGKIDTIKDLLMPLIKSIRFRWPDSLQWHINRKNLKHSKNNWNY